MVPSTLPGKTANRGVRTQFGSTKTMTCRRIYACVIIGIGLILCIGASPAFSIELRTYKIADDQGRWLHFGGGTSTIAAQASLAGSFDVEVDDYGVYKITRFDVRLIDILNEGDIAAGWTEGDLLAPKLFVHPVGLVGGSDGNQTAIGHSKYSVIGPGTQIELWQYSTPPILLNIFSFQQFDNISPRFDQSRHFVVELVPEPASSLLAFIAVACGTTWLRPVRSRLGQST
jgi:hypothetical protein